MRRTRRKRCSTRIRSTSRCWANTVSSVSALFLGLFGLAWLTAGKVRRLTRKDPELLWLGDLAAMVQVCLVGYLVGGAFLGLAYFDLPYHLVCMVVIARLIVEQRIRSRAAAVVPAMPRRVSRPRAALPVGAAQQP